MNDDTQASVDDALASDDEADNSATETSQTNSPPAAPAGDMPASLPADHPLHDSGNDPTEAYQDGEDAAAGITEEPADGNIK